MVIIDSALSNFEKRYSVNAFGKIPVTEYVSNATGLTVVLAEIEGPIVNGYFCLATEAFDDDGLPHTLEHLIFLGSENYPFKGVLDLLANRCLASGTNAWTETDHTCYTMETAGSDGFLALLPIYLEHILYPTLDNEAFVTEVHHITAEGTDGGVVYCEMQGRENDAETRLKSALLRNLYPGHCGYSSEVGGIMKNMRESTTNTKVRDFHRAFYRPENLKVIILGQVKPEAVFAALVPIEAQIIAKGPRGSFERPWQTPVPEMPSPVEVVVKYPADEEVNGIFAAAFRGPSVVNDYYTVQAVQFLLRYLTEFPTSPLNKVFVENDDPYGSGIGVDLSEWSESCIYIILQDVPVEKLPQVGPKLKEVLKSISDNKDIDMTQLHSIISKFKLESLSSLETNPHKTIATMLIGQMLYGNTAQELEQRINPVSLIDKFLDQPASYWLELLDKYLVNNPKAVYCQDVPSIEEQQRMSKEEADRIDLQIKTLGEAGLLQKKELLENAIAHNERIPPHEMLVSVPIPGLDSIHFNKIERFNSDSEDKDRIDLSNTPVYVFFDHIESNFVYCFATLDSSSVPSDLKIYIPLLLKVLFESPIERDGEVIPYEIVVAQLNDDTISNGSSLGLIGGGNFSAGGFSSTITVAFQFDAAKYEVGVKWLREILYNTVITPERLLVTVNKINNSVSQFKRDPSGVVGYAMNGLRFIEDSNIIKSGVLQQSKFLNDVIQKLESNNAEASNEVIQNLQKVQKIITDPANVVLYFAANLNILENPAQALNQFLPPGLADVIKQCKLNVTSDVQLLKDPSESSPGCIIGMGSLESSFFMQTTKAISSKNDPDYPALRVFLNYLGQAEGPLWKNIRGKGFAYSYSLSTNIVEGLLYVDFARATNVLGAYNETKAIVDKQLNSKEWDDSLLASAKSSLIFEVISQEKTNADAAQQSFCTNFFGVEPNFNKTLLEEINKVTVDDLNRVGEKYVAALFDPSKVKTAIVIDPAKVNEVAAGFKELGLNLVVYNSLEDSFLNNL